MKDTLLTALAKSTVKYCCGSEGSSTSPVPAAGSPLLSAAVSRGLLAFAGQAKPFLLTGNSRPWPALVPEASLPQRETSKLGAELFRIIHARGAAGSEWSARTLQASNADQ